MSDTGFAYPKRWSEISNTDPVTAAVLDARQRELEQFLYGAPEAIHPVQWLRGAPSPGASALVFSLDLVRHNRIRGRQILLSWMLQVSDGSGGVSLSLYIGLPKALWPNPSNGVPASAGSAAQYSSAKALISQSNPQLLDLRGTLGTWVVLIGPEPGTNNILAGHIVYGIVS